ncbi:MAG: tRNA-dihydrouridine synthase family protein, partial [Oscillospiraceae bacterium]|nr:tRNA-dihydrouridine synthase family protein [Oscillospiraceae bacterium]
AVMIGRALIADPGMLCGGTTAKALEGFLGELTEEYIREFGSARNAMFRLKENWGFLRHHFENSDKLWKQLRKTTDIHEYNAITAQILHTLPLTDGLNVEW